MKPKTLFMLRRIYIFIVVYAITILSFKIAGYELTMNLKQIVFVFMPALYGWELFVETCDEILGDIIAHYRKNKEK